jgi:tRNA(fMet)-specific endonuclease VapC
MTWLLDTNACIRYLNGRSSKLRSKLDATDPADIRVCSVVKAELYFGAARTTDPVKTLKNQRLFLSRFPSLPFDDSSAEAYGEIRSDLTRRGLMIGPNDLMIASICRANSVTLVTHNISEFGRVAGLAIEDWEA